MRNRFKGAFISADLRLARTYISRFSKACRLFSRADAVASKRNVCIGLDHSLHSNKADFWWIYIREAHPTNSARPARHVQIAQPLTFQSRFQVAQGCTAALNLKIPQLVDDMKDSVSIAYAASPDQLYILGPDRKVVYQGEPGPRGFNVDQMEVRLKELLARRPLPKA